MPIMRPISMDRESIKSEMAMLIFRCKEQQKQPATQYLNAIAHWFHAPFKASESYVL
jgi:hypothetical protein